MKNFWLQIWCNLLNAQVANFEKHVFYFSLTILIFVSTSCIPYLSL